MPPHLHPWLVAVVRVFATIIGCAAFYIALFMYADDKQRWQNRLEAEWIAVHDRARKTDTLFTAAVNKVAQVLVRTFDRIFGHKAFSLQLIAVSTNTAIFLSTLLIFTRRYVRARLDHSEVFAIVCFVAFASALAAITFRSRWVHLLSCFPAMAVICITGWEYMSGPLEYGHETRPLIISVPLLLSLLIDVLCLIIIRRLFALLAWTVSLASVLVASILLGVISFVVTEIPLEVGHWLIVQSIDLLEYSRWSQFLMNSGLMLGNLCLFDLMTATYCLLPALLLVGLALHRLVWPMLAHLIYPIAENKVLQQRKVLLSLGALALSIAFGLQRLNVADILKHFQ